MSELEQMIALEMGEGGEGNVQKMNNTEEGGDISVMEPIPQVEELREEKQVFDNIPRLHNPTPPTTILKHEKFEHRMICLLKAQGFSNTEIAEQMGYGVAAIGNILKQPWNEDMVLKLMHKHGEDAVQKTLREEAPAALARLLDMAKSDKVKFELKEKINQSFLDRVYGKANQPLRVSTEMKDLNSIPDNALVDMLPPEVVERLTANGRN